MSLKSIVGSYDSSESEPKPALTLLCALCAPLQLLDLFFREHSLGGRLQLAGCVLWGTYCAATYLPRDPYKKALLSWLQTLSMSCFAAAFVYWLLPHLR
jgi:hypothetical protein